MAMGLAASLLFAVTFVLNRSMHLSGGSWIWSGVLRFLFMIPFLLAVVGFRGGLRDLFRGIAEDPWRWLLWSTVGFGVFYAPMCLAASYGASWLVAGTWQVTIIAGSILSYRDGGLRARTFAVSLLILLGVILTQAENAGMGTTRDAIACFFLVLIAAFAYPLGNRRMMAMCADRFDTCQRVLGMTLASMPFWLILGGVGLTISGPPAVGQVVSGFIVALSSGVFATLLFFGATERVRKDPRKLAVVEATQAGEVVFATLGDVLLLGGRMPGPVSIAGLLLIVAGMTGHSRLEENKPMPSRGDRHGMSNAIHGRSGFRP